jgi:hypothetical protein
MKLLIMQFSPSTFYFLSHVVQSYKKSDFNVKNVKLNNIPFKMTILRGVQRNITMTKFIWLVLS